MDRIEKFKEAEIRLDLIKNREDLPPFQPFDLNRYHEFVTVNEANHVT